MKFKAIFLGLLMLLITFVSSAQVTLTFTGEDVLGQHVQMHHVVIENLSQNWLDTLYFPDTIFVIHDVGIEQYSDITSFGVSQNVPNPFDGVTDFMLSLPYPDNVSFEVYSINGCLITQKSQQLSAGMHSFRVLLNTPQTYVLTVKTSKDKTSIKMVNQGGKATESISYLGEVSPITYNLKSSKAHSYHDFNIGDEMRYIGYMMQNGCLFPSDTIENTLVGEEFYTFTFPIWVEVHQLDTTANFNSIVDTTTIFIPDGQDCGNGCTTTIDFNVSGYAVDSYVESVNDIKYVRLKMEHSYIGDLWIALSCPNGTQVPILKKKDQSTVTTECTGSIPASDWGWQETGGSDISWMGLYYEPDNDNTPCNPVNNPIGVCWNYCWSNDTIDNYQYACGNGYVYEVCNHIMVNNPHGVNGTRYVDSSNVSNMTNVYHPDVSFANFIGCPLNGTWSIKIIDGFSRDNGYISEAELALIPNVYDTLYAQVTLPTVSTIGVDSITDSSAFCSGEVVSDGYLPVTMRGMCWDTVPNPTINSNHTIDSGGTGVFTSCLNNLTPYITYYFRAYATNALGTSYGDEFPFMITRLPSVTTDMISSISDSSAILLGTLTDNGGGFSTEVGFCWSTFANPTLADSHTSCFIGSGAFRDTLFELNIPNHYYVRAYASNLRGTAYGNILNFNTITSNGTPCPNMGTVADFDGNVYNTVQIGTQCWTRENLRSTHYSDDGSAIPVYHDGSSLAYYSLVTTNNPRYGHYYTQGAAIKNNIISNSIPSGIQGVCPNGWHVPSEGEWAMLLDFLKNQPTYHCGDDSLNIAKALSEQTNWQTSTTNCAVGNTLSLNNSTGFSALPAGIRDVYSYPEGYATEAWFLSTTRINNGSVPSLYINYDSPTASISSLYYYAWFHSVRCVKD